MLAAFADLGGNFHGVPWNGPLGHDHPDLRELAAGRKNEPRLRCGGCCLQKCCSLSTCSKPLAELCLVKSVVPATQRKGAAEPLCPGGCSTSSKEGRGLHLQREGARHLHLWSSSGGELTDVNLLQMPNLLLALDLGFFSTGVLGVLKMRRRNFSDKELKKVLCL